MTMTETEIMQQAAAAHARIEREMDNLRETLGKRDAELSAKNEMLEQLKTGFAQMLAEIKKVHQDEHDRVRLALIDEQVRSEGLRHELDQAKADLHDLQALFGIIRNGVEQFELRTPIKRRNGGSRKRSAVVTVDDIASGKPVPDVATGADEVADIPPFLARPE